MPVWALRQYEFVDAVRELHRIAEPDGDDAAAGVIEFGPIEDFLPKATDEGGEAEHEREGAEGAEGEGDDASRSDGAKAATEAH